MGASPAPTSLSIECKAAAGSDLIRISGSMLAGTQKAMAAATAKAGKVVTFDFGGLTVISSSGVREWVTYLAAFEGGRTLTFVNCPHGVIGAIGMVPRFAASATIKSFLIDFRCASCGLDQRSVADLENDVKGDVDWQPAVPCQRCGREMPPLTPVSDVLDVIFALPARGKG